MNSENVINAQRVGRALASTSPYPDYEMVFKLLKRPLKSINILQSGMSDPKILREYCTINLGGARQTGKTLWAINKVIEGGAVIISRDRAMRDDTARRLTDMFAKTEHGATVVRENGLINITLDENDRNPAMTVDFIMAQWKLSTQRHVYTARDLNSISEQEDGVDTHFAETKLFIIDDAFFNSRLKEIYQWIATHIQQKVTIVLLG